MAIRCYAGLLRSEMMLDAFGVREENWRDAAKMSPHSIISLASDSERARWNGQSLSSGHLAKTYGFTALDGSRPDAWRYTAEVQDAGKPADTTGYR
jgi:hypothetical protein